MISICLAMIVKDEAPVIRRALASVAPYVAHWIVCDTGSTDGTPAIVQDALHGIPGELFHDAWVDFSTNRNLALDRARATGCDYTLMLDADEIFSVEHPSVLEGLDADSYIFRGQVGQLSWLAERMVKTALPWRYVGVIHEALKCEAASTHVLHHGISISTPQDGHRSQDPAKYEKDIAVLERAMQDEPDNARMLFHLAMGYQLVGRREDAAAAFRRRLELAGQDTELWYSRYQLAKLAHQDGDDQAAMALFLECYADFPQAAEPLYWLARCLMDGGWFEHALPFLELASTKSIPTALFITEDQIYVYEARLYWALCLVRLNRPEDANGILLDLAQRGVLPDGAIDSAERAVLQSFQERVVA